MSIYTLNRTSMLPAEYQEVEYIQGSGTQYIDTLIKLSSSDTIKAKFELNSAPTSYSEGVFGTMEPISSNNTFFTLLMRSPSLARVGTSSHQVTSTNVATNTIYTIELSNGTYIENGTTYTFTPSNAFTFTKNCYVFLRNQDSMTPVNGKFYSFEIVGKFKGVPCYRKADGVIGLYDFVSEAFFTNAGTGTFIKGNDVGGSGYESEKNEIVLLKKTNNLLKLTRTEWNSNSYQPTDTVTFDYNKLYYMAGSGYIRPKENSLNETITNHSVTFTATNSSWWGIGFPIKVKPNTKYTISLKRTDGNKTKPIYTIYNADGTFSRYSQVSTNTSLLDITNTITTGATETTLIIVIAGMTQGDTVYAYDIQVEEGQTATAFKPYGYETKKYKIVFLQQEPLADTVLSLSAGSQTSATLNIYKTNTTATEIYLDDTLVTTSTTSGTQDISVTIPSGTSTLKISGGTFYFDSYCLGSIANNALLTDISYGNNYGNTIGNEAFRGCTGLTSITIPNSVTNIGNSAFGSCTGLTSVTIGSGVTSIGTTAFGSCTGLTSITILAIIPPTLSSFVFNNTNSCPIYVPSGSVTAYQSASSWSSYSSRIQAIPV